MSIQIQLDLRPQDFEFRGYEVMLKPEIEKAGLTEPWPGYFVAFLCKLARRLALTIPPLFQYNKTGESQLNVNTHFDRVT